jgi:prephenate dehydrogenase
MRTAGVIGTGLVGGSVAAGLTLAGWDVVGYDADPDSIVVALERGLMSAAVDSIEEMLAASPEIVVVAAPPKATVEILANLDTSLVVMDVAGVKTEVMSAAAHLSNFVGTHPMAGRETAGPRSASAALFRGANWVVIDGCPQHATEITLTLVETLGANPVMMSATHHDHAVAAISHLPQLLAAGLLNSAAGTPSALDLAAGSFRDLTRVAASQPLPWVEMLKSNSVAVLSAVEALRDELAAIEAAVLSDDDDLLVYLSRSRSTRRSLGAPVVAVRVSLADEPGEIARVGHALEVSHVDVRDLQMRHAPHGGGGVLTLSVRAGEEEALRHALSDVGFQTIP